MTGKKFEKKIWFYLMLISAMPVLVLGVVSYVFSIGYAAEQLEQPPMTAPCSRLCREWTSHWKISSNIMERLWIPRS